MSKTGRRIAAIAPLLALLGACEGPPASPIGRLQAGLVVDRTVHTFTRRFQVSAFSATTAEAQPLTCADFPGSYTVADPRLKPLAPPAVLEWTGQVVDARMPVISVPARQPMVLIALGLAPSSLGDFAVGRGCADQLSFAGGTKQEVNIDVRATTGKPCAAGTGCEPALECQQGQGFLNGYCATKGCTKDIECLPGSRCTSGDATFGNLCMRICLTPTDCEPGQDCLGRLGPDGNCDTKVCGNPTWNTGSSC